MRSFTYRGLLPVAIVALAVAGCGGGSHKSSSSSSSSTTATTTPPSGRVVTIPGPAPAQPIPVPTRPSAAAVAQKCPAGRATMGCAVSATPNLHRGPGLAIPPVALFPDVSVWQGAVNWSAVAGWQRSHGWHPLAIWKLGEYRIDSQARRNAQQTRALGFYGAGYWFVRNTGCSREAGQIVTEARAEGLTTVVEDDEVPEARGYAACLTPRLKAAGLRVIEYSAPGTNPDGGSNPGVSFLWVAAYGPQTVPCLFTCSVGQLDRQSIVAWQMTDGVFGFVTSVPGVGNGDVSADYGISRVIAGATGTSAGAAGTATPQLRVLLAQAFPTPWGRLNERQIGARFLGAFAHRAKFRGYLHGLLHAELAFLAGRIAAVAVTQHKGWHGSNRGPRFQFLLHDAEEASRA